MGAPQADFGAHSYRIGGATDLANSGEATELHLKARGRWASDIGKIYSRLARSEQLKGSDLMYKAHGRDLEEMYDDFTQPA